MSLTSLTRGLQPHPLNMDAGASFKHGPGHSVPTRPRCSSASLHFNHSHAYVLNATKRTLLYCQVLPRNWFFFHVCFSRMELRVQFLISLCCSVLHHPLPLVFYSTAWERSCVSLFCLQWAEQREKPTKGEYSDL